MKILKIILLISCIFLKVNSACTIEGRIEYDSVYIDYNKLNLSQYYKKGEDWLNKAQKEKNDIKRENYYREAISGYDTVLQINPEHQLASAKIGHIYSKLKKHTLAKSYLNRAYNLNENNPLTNFYFAEFYYNESDFLNAKKHYLKSVKHGYSNNYDANLNLAKVYEKLADLSKANYYYKRAYSLKKTKEIDLKIKELESLKYDKSQYHLRPKPYYKDE